MNRYFFKYIVIVALIFSVVCSFSGCSKWSGDYAATSKHYKVSSESYLANLFLSYNEACSLVSSKSGSILNQTINGNSSVTWIHYEAIDKIKILLTVDELMNEFSISLNEQEIEKAKSDGNTLWEQNSDLLESKGVTRDVFDESYGILNAKKYKLLNTADLDISAMSLETGNKNTSSALNETDLEHYFKENYISYSYIKSDFANSNNLSASEESIVKEQFLRYENYITTGSYNMRSLANRYKSGDNLTYDTLVEEVKYKNDISLPNEVKTELLSLSADMAKCVRTDTEYYLIYKNDISKSVTSLNNNTFKDEVSNKISQSNSGKSSSPSSQTLEHIDEILTYEFSKYNIEINSNMINKYAVNLFETT